MTGILLKSQLSICSKHTTNSIKKEDSYTLDGRKASHLKIPAYRCYGAGDVTVIITVNNAGQVVGAKVMESISSEDLCLRNFAVRAARLSRFSASTTAPANQTGEILYRFIARN